MLKPVLVAIGFSLVAAAVFLTPAPAQAQTPQTCSESDVPCRLTRIEQKLDRLLATRSGNSGGAPVVDMSLNQMCGSSTGCNDVARQECREQGFVTGTAAETEIRNGYHYVRRANCIGLAQPN